MKAGPITYPALMDGREGAYGVVIPDLPGCVAMGYTVENALNNARDAMKDWMEEIDERGLHISPPSPVDTIEVPEGAWLTSVQRT